MNSTFPIYDWIIDILEKIYFRDNFEAAVAVNITCLLSMSNFLIAMYENLPKTSQPKIMDYLQEWVEAFSVSALEENITYINAFS